MAGAGDGSKTEFGQTVGKDRVITMHMSMIMLTDRRARRASASVLLAVYSVMLITGLAVMFRSDPPDIETDKAMDCGGTAATCGHDPFPTAGIIRYIYDIEGLCTVSVSAEPFSISGEDTGRADEVVEENDAAEESAQQKLIAYFGYLPTADEIDLFYRTVQAECGNTEPDEGIGAVADVIANRCRSEYFPDTIDAVITQKNQFETWSNGAVDAAEPNERVLEICDEHISSGAEYTEIYFFTAGEYNEYCEPMFVIGHHYFGTLREEVMEERNK